MNDQTLGIVFITAAIIGIVLYGWLIFLINPVVTLQVTAVTTILILLGIAAWIGYTMATMPPPEPFEVEDTL